MTDTPTDVPGGRVFALGGGLGWFASRANEVLDRVDAERVWALTDSEVVETASELDRLLPRLQQRRLAVVAEASRRALPSWAPPSRGAHDTSGTGGRPGPETAAALRRDRRLAEALEAHQATRSAAASGGLRLEQARVIVAAVDALPPEVAAEDRRRAEAHLVSQAVEHDADALKVLGRHLLEVVAPDLADEHCAAVLEAEEKRAARSTFLTVCDDGGGRCHGRFTISSLHGAMLTTALSALANPALPEPIARAVAIADGGDAVRHVPHAEVLGRAFAQLIERYPADRLPTTGGVNAQVVVTVPLETLEGRLGSAQVLGTGLELSPGAALRLGCAAGVVPAVLDGRGQVLDLGRRRRLHTRPQRLALAIGQGGSCAAERCDVPATWSEAHHLRSWSAGGTTSLENGVLLCGRHHTLAHTRGHDLTRLPDGTVRFHRRT